MDRAEKAEFVASLQGALESTSTVVVAHYAGLPVSKLENLRVQMKQAGGQVRVAKNRLAKLALKQTELADVSDLLVGPTLLAYSDDPVTAAKVAVAFAKENEEFVILGGAMQASALDTKGVEALATMPSLDELRAKLAGLVKQPATNIASVVQAPGGAVARVIGAYANKGEAA